MKRYNLLIVLLLLIFNVTTAQKKILRLLTLVY